MSFLKKEDYEEPCCPLKMQNQITSIPIRRVIEKLDEYLSRNDYENAEKHLLYWEKEAEAGGDKRGKLTVLNEQIGLYRKISKKAEAFTATKSAEELVNLCEFEDNITGATTYLNIATALKSFDNSKDALGYYEKAKTIYEKELPENDYRLGGLYNNLALVLCDLDRLEEAKDFYFKALDIMSKNENCEGEQAITYLNLCDLIAKEKGMENGEKEISQNIEKAYDLLINSTLEQNGDYAFICEKCAPTFLYYGYFAYSNELNERAKRIYERD